ncbi:hypothetical protein QJQ45_010673 [Haematococcus lacustris]|nr:hypothetical protein QJQ45_010673 [Haematococcus lacustris]
MFHDDVGLMEESGGDVIKGQHLQGLEGLPAKLLDAVLSQLDASSRLPVFRTSKILATALLRVVPRIQLTYPTQHDVIGQNLRELAPFLTEVLQNRQQPKLHLTLQPAMRIREPTGEAEPAAAVSDISRLVAWTLGAVPLCVAVDSLTIGWHHSLYLPWEHAFSAALAASFPSLTSLTFKDVSIGYLVYAIDTLLLLPQLLHLDLQNIITEDEGQLGDSWSPFIGSRLQTLSLHACYTGYGESELLLGLVPLPPTLTQLTVSSSRMEQWDWVRVAAAVSDLTQLQQLRLIDEHRDWYVTGPGPMPLLSALVHLPSLHTLEVDEYVEGQEQLDALLALTQITSLKLLTVTGLTSSRASAACSWRQLEVHTMDWDSAAYMPMHSLTHPLHLTQLVGDNEEPSIEVLAAAELNLFERNKAGLVLNWGMCLSKATVDLLTEQYLSHICPADQQPPHPTVASSSSHSGPSTSLASSSSPAGHIMAGGPGSSTGQGGQQGSAAGAQPLMQRTGRCAKALRIIVGLYEARLSSANRQALAVLFPVADIEFSPRSNQEVFADDL